MVIHQKSKVSSPWFFLGLLTPIFLIVIVNYISTLNPALFRNDSPETITACYSLGVSHSPSYPLHTLLGHLFSLIPLGNPAFVLNFFAAFLSAVGVCLFATYLWTNLKTSFNTSKNDFASLYITIFVSCLLFSFSESYWGNSISAKGSIYIFQAVLELFFLFHIQDRLKNPNNKESSNGPYFLVFLFTLGLINHWPTQVLLVPALIFVFLNIYYSLPKKPNPNILKNFFVCATITIIVLSAYLYLPLRSHLFPDLNFGAPFTFSRFIRAILRTEYSKIETLASYNSPLLPKIQEKAYYILNHFLTQFHPSSFVLVLFGLYFLIKTKQKNTLYLFLIVLFTTLSMNLIYLQTDPIEFWHINDHLLTVNWILGLLIGFGFFQMVFEISKLNIFGIKKIIFLVLIVTLLYLGYSKNFHTNDQKRQFLYYGYGIEALRSMSKNALYFSESDYDSFSILYLQDIIKKRPDVSLFVASFLKKDYEYELIAKQYPSLMNHVSVHQTSEIFDAPSFFRAIKGLRNKPIYCAFPNGDFSNIYLKYHHSIYFKPSGILIKILREGEIAPHDNSIQLLDYFYEHFLEPEAKNPNPVNGLFCEICAHPFLNTAGYEKIHGDLSHWDWLYEKALGLIQENPWLAQTWSDRGDGDMLFGNKPEAYKCYQMSGYEYLQIRQYKNAIVPLQKALKLHPENLDIQQTVFKLESIK